LRQRAKPDIFNRTMSHTGQISLSLLTSLLLAGLLLRGRAR